MSLVHIGKISSWFLLVVISVIIVAQLKHLKQGRGPSKDNPKERSCECSLADLILHAESCILWVIDTMELTSNKARYLL